MSERKMEAAGILGVGISVPENILTNYDLENMVDTSNEWIIKRTGILERRIIDKDKPLYHLGIEAAEKALLNAGIGCKELDLIIVATDTPDYLTPSMACLLQKGLSACNAAAFDLNAACTGFIYSLAVADNFIRAGYYRHILIVSCECLSRVVDWKDRSTCVLFGDAAAAAVVGPVEKNLGIIKTCLGAEGNLGRNLTIPCCYLSKEDAEKRPGDKKMTIWMDGSEVFKFAVRIMAEATEKIISDSGLSMNDIKLIIPHQANIRIIDGAVKRLGVSEDRVYSNIHRYGNISSASIPVALSEALKEGRIIKGDSIVLVGFGGGLTWGSVLIKWAI